MKKKKDMSREAKGKRLLRVDHEEKALTNSQAHSQEVLPNNDDSDLEIISSLLINNLNLYSKVMFQMSRKKLHDSYKQTKFAWVPRRFGI